MKEIKQTPLTPDPKLRRRIEEAVRAESHMCWTCRSCASECPVNQATSRLHPVKVVWMANLGLLDDLLLAPEIWYCQQCNRCSQICPMNVKPADIIAYTRNELVQRKLVSSSTVKRHQELFSRFQRTRWHMLLRCMRGEPSIFEESHWREWLETPVPISSKPVHLNGAFAKSRKIKGSLQAFNTAACFTCGECSSTCPLCYERGVFDPQWIFRMVNLGLGEELMRSPAIWMCLGCQRCTNACSQLVKGHHIIESLRQLAISEGFVAEAFPLVWKEYQKKLYNRLLDEVDLLFGHGGLPEAAHHGMAGIEIATLYQESPQMQAQV